MDSKLKIRFYRIVLATFLLIICLFLKLPEPYAFLMYLLPYLIVGYDVLYKAIKHLFTGQLFDENFLMSLATIGALFLGEYLESVMVMLLYQVGELFQSYAVGKSRSSITELMDIRPDYANIERDGKLEKVDPDDVKIGEIIVVKPGEKVPLDGIVREGESYLDTSRLTGESVPTHVRVKDTVLSGSVNQNGLLKIEVTKEFDESTASKILDLVENASSKKSKSENFITKFAKYYTPAVVIIAVFLAAIPPLVIESAEFTDWLYRALTFLVVSCPCALVISIPLGFFGGIGGASKRGILVKGSNYLEALANTEIVIFDKTGTLTQGVFEVQKIESEGISNEELLKYAAYAENYSNHPIGLSVKKAYGKKIDTRLILNTEELSGLGVKATIQNKDILIGNEKLMKENSIKYKKCSEIGTILYIAIDNKFVGYILIADKIKEDSKEAISKLKKNGIRKTIMLTGDRKDVGENVAKKLGLDEVYTELLPDGKVEKVEEIIKTKTEKGKLVFIGDGINDAPVLAISDIGIAMGGLGADSAIEAADVVIMTDEPSRINDAIKISKKTMKIVKQNIIFAIAIKILVLILSAFGLSTMWEAVFADVGVSVIAIINSLRALK